MSIITDDTTRERLVLLHAAVTAKAGTVAAAEREVRDLEAKARTLRSRVADQERPAPTVEPDTRDLAAALVADPQAAFDEEGIEAATHAQVQADRTNAERRARVAVLNRALSNVTRLIEGAQSRVEMAEREHDAALSELANESHQALLGEFRTRFVALHDAVVAPMLALQACGVTKRDHLSEDSLVLVRTWTPGVDAPRGGGMTITDRARSGFWSDERLLSFGGRASEKARLSADQAIDSFYASLSL